MWMAGALGVCCSAGYYVIALMATVLTVIIPTVQKNIEFPKTEAPKDAKE